LRSQLKFNEKVEGVYFLGKMSGSIPQIVKGTPGLGRVGKQDLVHMIDTELRGYEREFKALNIHLFDEVLELISYVERVLTQARRPLASGWPSWCWQKDSLPVSFPHA